MWIFRDVQTALRLTRQSNGHTVTALPIRAQAKIVARTNQITRLNFQILGSRNDLSQIGEPHMFTSAKLLGGKTVLPTVASASTS